MMTEQKLPLTGYLHLPHIIGDAKRGIIGVFPVSRSAWYRGVKSGVYPQPVKLSGGRSVAWDVEDIRKLIDSLKKPTDTSHKKTDC